MPGKHARLSPSAAARWANCPASVELDDRVRKRNDGVLPDDSTKYAEIGTLCHEYAELEIKKRFWPTPDVFEARQEEVREKLKELCDG